MGILEKTAAMAEEKPSGQAPPEFLPPPPPPLPVVALGSVPEPQLKQEELLPVSIPTLGAGTAVAVLDPDDDTVSTVSGGSDLQQEEENEQSNGDQEDPIDESYYRELLR